MPDAQPEISEGRRISFIWVVPIVSVLIGVWMIVWTFQSEGPTITIDFASAEGIEPGTTKIKALNLDVGLVESARLSDSLDRVLVIAQMDPEASDLLREDTQFWVVRPRIGRGGVSGLGTLLSGGYIELAPGVAERGARRFKGLDQPPVTPAGTPGLRLELVSDNASSVGAGDPILYEGYEVGRVETEEFDVATRLVRYRAFIEAPYDELVTSNTRFWNTSGVAVNVGTEGIEVKTGSLESLLVGGIAMGLPSGMPGGDPIADMASFEIYPDYASVNARPWTHGIPYVVLFSQSVRGLSAGAPVEFRGIHAGRVERILLEQFAKEITGKDDLIPVLIRLEPGPLGLPDTDAGEQKLRETVERAVENGLRVTLATGNLLTGSLYVSLGMRPEAGRGEIGEYAGYPTLPTIGSGLDDITTKLTLVLDKINELPLEQTIGVLNRAIRRIDALVASEDIQGLPEQIDATLAELRGAVAGFSPGSEFTGEAADTIQELERTLRSLRDLAETLDEQPNAILFNRESGSDPQPSRGTP